MKKTESHRVKVEIVDTYGKVISVTPSAIEFTLSLLKGRGVPSTARLRIHTTFFGKNFLVAEWDKYEE